ncbi:MAG: DUF2332 domain-containing protein [Hyphomonadaceae bacterium]|nr:DUF2332 domain-containing protein [Hyphomonadaceae bacterium]
MCGAGVSADRVLAHFREQAMFCAAYGSPFTGQLLEHCAADVEAGGPVAPLVHNWPTNPRADVVGLRLAGALHAAVLTGRDEALAAAYPKIGSAWSMERVWRLARAFIERESDWVRDFLQVAPQTNETRRSIAMLTAFLAFAKQWSGPIDMLEIGASAGLNLNWDRFAYRTGTWSWGGDSPVVMDTDWHGPAPAVDARPNIRSRAACDLNPLDIRDEVQRLRLKSYIWPDQPDRLARFDGAVALALQHDVRVDRASADAWLSEKLARRAGDAATLVYHSVFLQYPPKEVRDAIVGAIHEAGARATAHAPLAWVRLEPEGVTDGVAKGLRFVIDLHTWPRGERRILGYTDGHVRTVYAQ